MVVLAAWEAEVAGAAVVETAALAALVGMAVRFS